MLLLQLLLMLILIIGVIIAVAYLWESKEMKKPDRIIYYASNLGQTGPEVAKLVQKYILDNHQKTEDYTLYEPGAGLGHMARYLARAYTWKNVEAVDIGSIILWLGKFWHRLLAPKLKVDFILADVISYSADRPTVIYGYLSASILTKMYQKEKMKNALVITLTFPIQGVEPTEIIELKNWQSPLRVYDFRTKTKIKD